MTATVIFHLLLVAGVVLMALMAVVPVLVDAVSEVGLAAPRTCASTPPTALGVDALAAGARRPRNGASTPASPARDLPRAA